MKNRFKQVIPIAMRFLKGRFEKKIIWSLISFGTLIIGQSFTQNWWINFVIDMYNDHFNRNMPYPVDSSQVWNVLLSLLAGGSLIVLAIYFYFRTKNREKLKPMLLIQHSSIQMISYSNINKDLSDYNLEQYPLNQLEEFKSMDRVHIYHALREQEKTINRIASRIDGSSGVEVAYMGLAHIPVTMLLGYQLSDKSSPMFYEWNQNELIWEQIESKPNFKFPILFLEKKDTQQEIQSTREVVVKIGITYPIGDEDIQELQFQNLNSYYLHLNPPHRNAVISSEQLKTYKKNFRDLLDQINQRYPQLQTIHLFYSGQPSLAYTLGSAISSRMDVDIWIYNHVRNESPKYKWGIKLPKENTSLELKINEMRVNIVQSEY
ncbi:SAVED domain-containing protein [Paenibacillus polymyxa]|uniref:SMODS-associated and fused to various effectors domain-containing protein n=1 Tax=Paenibacillus polymyxa (strain SC2) TaxID=886882 RepID=A0A0D5ZCQ2_PAEPS|nr:SAVED domain-containing protein [Paenibacillus polymyxa]AKA44349.1 hypothetical protein PPSC2_26330 [Paenibacillus polymyxa SC2]WPQ59999.1 SAVED domain-containing protein [Paenibacillus polymyxa]